ncbi:hypothetical protein [Streptomyces silvisoli]|uniref:Sensor histidine kinase n=1 Tax=Streptomyces silvisoli TaxID=3034235 RepID=A0ABT5ZUN6_9ACTN|nr:hypothetical protein [Streptomyces silvisoli]MDF3293536.1 hypothetical protein [Streptomyces silvisoli]
MTAVHGLRLARDLTEAMGGTLEPARSGPAFSVALAFPRRTVPR